MKLSNTTDWYRLARAQAQLESNGVPVSAEVLARHVEYGVGVIRATLEDATYQEFADQFRRRRFGLWAESLAKAGTEIQQLMRNIGFKAMLVVEDLLDSPDDKVRVSAARLAFDFNPELERPVVRHEITNRFTADEMEQAREIVRKLRAPKVIDVPASDKPN